MAEYIHTKDLFKVIDESFPDLSNMALARIIDRDESGLRRQRKRSRMRLETADHILTCLDLSYTLSSGEIPVYQGNPSASDLKNPRPKVRRSLYDKFEAEIKRQRKQLDKLETELRKVEIL